MSNLDVQVSKKVISKLHSVISTFPTVSPIEFLSCVHDIQFLCFFFFYLIDKPVTIDSHDSLVLTVSVMSLFRVFLWEYSDCPIFSQVDSEMCTDFTPTGEAHSYLYSDHNLCRMLKSCLGDTTLPKRIP